MPQITMKAGAAQTQLVEPTILRQLRFHGVDLHWRPGAQQATGDCPWCGKAGKFSVEVATSLWRCWSCSTGSEKGGGNLLTFLRTLWKLSDERTNGESDTLRADRGLLYPETLNHWGIVKSIITGDWLVPGYNVDGKLVQLYKWVPKGGSRVLMATPEVGHEMHGLPLFNKSKSTIHICEGWGDGSAWWEALRITKPDGTIAASEASSLLADINVVAAPGCGSIGEPFARWLPLFKDKAVVWMGDSDHPRSQCSNCRKAWSIVENSTCPNCKIALDGRVITPAGYDAARRASEMLSGVASEVRMLNWGSGGTDPTLKSGFDIRDWMTRGKTAAERARLAVELLTKVTPIPADWVTAKPAQVKHDTPTLECIPCHDWESLTKQCRIAMRWTDSLDVGLSVMLASIVSTRSVGDQLWVLYMSPPSSGKSSLCEAISVSRNHVYPLDQLRGMHSGWREPGTGENVSLVLKLKDKTLVIKDGDPLLQAANKLEILAELRALYDTCARTDYRNGMGMNHEGLRMTMILCGTSALSDIDSSELGARYLKCRMHDTDDDLQDEITRRVVFRSLRNVALRANCDPTSNDDPDMVTMKGMTGGYIDHLCSLPEDSLEAIVANTDDAVAERIVSLGTFVAYLRARPPKIQSEQVDKELPYRLGSVLARLGACLALVLNRDRIDGECMRRVTKVALDTAAGRTLEIAKHLYDADDSVGCASESLATWCHESGAKMRELLQFLTLIGVCEVFILKAEPGLFSGRRYKISARMRRLWSEVMAEGIE